jgi:S-adenosylmethionine/arginine decarboxylase-like enzyme
MLSNAIGAPEAAQDTISPTEPWGIATAVDLHDCAPELIRNAGHIRRYVEELCDLIKMNRYGDCQVVHFGEGRVAGYSMTQLIETSLISGHFANETNRAYLDIFSCKAYDPEIVEAFTRNFFKAQTSRRTVVPRY